MDGKPRVKEACRWALSKVAACGRKIALCCHQRAMNCCCSTAVAATGADASLPPPPHVSCSKIFGSAAGLVDMLVRWLPSSKAATATKVERCYTGACCAVLCCDVHKFRRQPACTAVSRLPCGACCAANAMTRPPAAHASLHALCSTTTPSTAGPQDSQLVEHMRACNPRGPLVIYVCKVGCTLLLEFSTGAGVAASCPQGWPLAMAAYLPCCVSVSSWLGVIPLHPCSCSPRPTARGLTPLAAS